LAKQSTNSDPQKDSVEKRAVELLRVKIRERKLKPAELAKALDPPLSESQLRHLLNGGSSLTLDRFYQIAKLIQVDPLEILHHANPDPKFEQPFSHEQEKFLAADPWRYRMMKALSLPRTESELSRLLPECTQLHSILRSLVERKIVLEIASPKDPIYRVNASTFQLATIDFVEGYTELLLANAKSAHETTVEIERIRPDLIKFIRNMMVVDYLTPEQMITLRDRLVSTFAEFRKFVGHNRMDSSYAAVAKQNLICFITLMAPLNRTTFMKRGKT
jgi:hypothetical protein